MYLSIIVANLLRIYKYATDFPVELVTIPTCIALLVVYYWKGRVESITVEDDSIYIKILNWGGPRMKVFKLGEVEGRLIEENNKGIIHYVLQIFHLGKMKCTASTADGFKKKKLTRILHTLSPAVK